VLTARYELNICNSNTSASYCTDTVVLIRELLLWWGYRVLLFLTYNADSFIAHSTEDTCICTAVKACSLCKVLCLNQTHRLQYCSVRASNQCISIYIPLSSMSLCKIQLDKRPDIPSDGCAAVQPVGTIPSQVTLVTNIVFSNT
jgi:hypothetical protein